MLLLDRLGAGGSYTEFYALDFDEEFVLMGHDGPGHVAIADGRPVLRALKLFHGKSGAGLSVEMKVRLGPVTILGLSQTADGRLKLLAAEGESIAGPTFRIGNTNSRIRFASGPAAFMDAWCAEGPTHHVALGVGHRAGDIRRIAALLERRAGGRRVSRPPPSPRSTSAPRAAACVCGRLVGRAHRARRSRTASRTARCACPTACAGTCSRSSPRRSTACARRPPSTTLRSVGVDAWGVDYALLDARGRVLGLPFHYRDERTVGMVERAHARVPRDELYRDDRHPDDADQHRLPAARGGGRREPRGAPRASRSCPT